MSDHNEPILKKETPNVNEQQPENNEAVVKEETAIINKKQDTVNETQYVVDPVEETSNTSGDVPIPYPSSNHKVLMDILTTINEMNDKIFRSSFSDKDTEALKINNDSVNYTNKDNALYDSVNNDGMINNFKYADKELGIRPLKIGGSGNLNGDAAIAKLANIIGVGETIQVPLWHSGFWVTLKPVKDVELINLDMQITNNQITLGRDTNTLIFSNYSVVFNRIVTNFIINHIQSTTLDLPTGEDLREYISVQDLYTLVNSLLYSMHPRGYPLIRTCSNSNVLNAETNKPKCSHTIEAKIDFRKMLWVDRKMLSKEHIAQMSKRTPGSVTTDDVIEYANTLPINKSKKIEVEYNGNKVYFILKTPTLKDYINNGEKWVNDIISKSEAIFTETTDNEEREAIINTTAAAMVMGVYNIYISEILFEDGSTIKNRIDIDDALTMLSNSQDLIKVFLDGIKEYINSNNISVIGITNYTCPACGEDQVKEGKDNFKEIIPINVLESFFDLCVLRIIKVRDNNIS